MPASARERIRAAALELFTRRGYAATATREICERARVTKPVLYYHFGSKEDLYRKLIVDACQEAFQELKRIASEEGSARKRLVDLLAADFARTRRNPELAALYFRLMFAARQEGPQIDYVGMGMHWAGILRQVIREGIRQGELEGNPQRIAMALLGTHVIYTMSFVLRGWPVLNRSLARSIVDLICSGCAGTQRRKKS